MAHVGLWDAVEFAKNAPKTLSQSLLERIDSCFYLGGKKVCVIPGYASHSKEGVIFAESSQPFFLTIKKIALLVVAGLPLLIGKYILHRVHHFHFINVEEQLGKGMEVSPQVINTMQDLIPKMWANQPDNRLLQKEGNKDSMVFRLKDAPHITFKMVPVRPVFGNGSSTSSSMAGKSDFLKKCFHNMVTAKKISLLHQLDQLSIPCARLFKVQAGDTVYTLLAQEHIDVPLDESIQEQRYREGISDEAVKQLAVFIGETGWNKVTWGCIPKLDSGKILLPNLELLFPNLELLLPKLEEMNDVEKGFFWAGRYRGLIHCLFSEQQIDNVLNIASIYFTSDASKKAKKERLEELDFYKTKEIFDHPRKPVPSLDNLSDAYYSLVGRIPMDHTIAMNFVIDDKDKDFTPVERYDIPWKQAVQDIINRINRALQRTPDTASTPEKRTVVLDATSGPLKDYNDDCLRARLGSNGSVGSMSSIPHLQRILEALVASRYIFKIISMGDNQYKIQV